MCRRNIYIMYFISLLQGMVFYGSIATLYRQAEGVSILQIAIIESISLALSLILELPWGMIADRIGYRRTMISCCFLYFVSKIIFWQATDFCGFLVERCVLGIVIAGLSGVDASVLYLSCDKEDSQRIFGIYEGLGTVGLLIATFVYSTVFAGDYRSAAFFTMIVYGFAAVFALGLREVKAERNTKMQIREFIVLLRTIFGNWYLVFFLTGIAVFNETHQTVTVFLNQLQYVRSGMSTAGIGAVYILVTIIGLCGVCSARVTKKIGAVRMLRLCFLSAIAACFGLMVTMSAWLSVLAVVVLQISFCMLQPLQMDMQNKQVTVTDRATALSVNALIMDSIGIGTNVAFGALAEENLAYAFFFGAALCAGGWALLELWKKGNKEAFVSQDIN